MLWKRRPFGVGRSILALTQALLHARADADLVLYGPRALPIETIGERPAPSGAVRIVCAPAWTSARAGRILWEQICLPRLASRDRLDLLQAPGYVLPARMEVPVVLLVHDLIALERPRLCRPLNRWHYALALPSSIRRASAIVAFSHRVKLQILDRFGASAPSITVVPPGIDDSFLRPLDQNALERVRRKYDLPERFLLFAATDEPKKNLKRLVQAFQLARQRGEIDGELVVTRELRLPENRAPGVRVLGFVADEDLPALFRLARVLAFPSLVEGFGLPILEAMVCGLPVVCSRVPAVEDSDPNAVLLIDPEQVDSIAHALSRAWNEDELRSTLIERGLRAAGRFRWETAGRALWQLYGQVLSANPRREAPASSR